MPRLKTVDDFAEDKGSRRSSGRARRPTAKIEALAGTKFYPADSTKANRTGSASLSPGPSADSSFSTPMSPQSDSALHASQDQTSPSTISVQVISPRDEHSNKRAPSTPASDLQTSNQPATHSLRRERKPTQRALEMTETATKPRRRRRTQAEMAALRASATPSDISSTADTEVPITDRRSSLGQQEATPSISTNAAPLRTASRGRRGDREPDDPEPIASRNLLNKRSASKPVPRGRQTTFEHSPTDVLESASSSKKKARRSPKKVITQEESEADKRDSSPPAIANGHGSDKPKQSRRTSTQQFRHSEASEVVSDGLEDDPLPVTRRKSRQKTTATSPPPKLETTSLRLKFNTRRSGRVSAQPEAETPRRRARLSAVNYAEPELSPQDTSSDETMSNTRDTTRRQPRAGRGLPDEAEPVEVKETTSATLGARRLRLRQPVPAKADLDTAALEDTDTESTTAAGTRAGRRSQKEGKSSISGGFAPSRKRQASPPEEERPRKSLKLKLSVPGLKTPSKLRFSINSQDLVDYPPKKLSVQMPPDTVNIAATKKRQEVPSHNAKEPSAPTEVSGEVHKAGPAPKLSRRAQAKAEARALGKIRQATESANHDRLYDTTYGGAASHYAPSLGLVRPAIDCGLFCLPEPSRILAFAKIAAQSIESDDEETSDGGRQPELLNKWLQKGGEHCVCNKPVHDHGEDMSGAKEDQPSESVQELVRGRDEAVQNADVAAVVPDIDLPLEIPPVNSIMPKSQGRRVSAFYNVLTGSPTSGPSINGSSASGSRQQSRSASAAQSSGSPVSGYATAPTSSSANASTAARPNTGSYEERMRWDHQALERVRREAKDTDLPLTMEMTYTQIKTLLEQHKEQHGASGSEGTNTPREVEAPKPSPGLSARAAGKRPDYTRDVGRAQTNNAYAHFEDDTEDRLLQIIGESFKATMKRNKSASAESRASTDSRPGPLGVRARS